MAGQRQAGSEGSTLAHLRAVLVVALAVGVCWLVGPVLLLLFAGVLVAVLLSAAARGVARLTSLGYKPALALVVVGMASTVAGLTLLLAPDVAAQIDEMRRQLPRAFDGVRGWMTRFDWGRELLQQQPGAGEVASSGGLWRVVAGAFSGTLGGIANLVIVGFVGLYLAIEPAVYRDGVVGLFPKPRRPRVADVLDRLASTLEFWLLGTMLSMLVVGLSTWIGLWAMGVPLALTLALMASALTFIPNIGPVLAAAPAILLGLLDGPRTAAMVAGLYLGIQAVETYLVTPIIQRKTIQLPPALTISAQVLLGVTAGGVGLLVATPLAAASLVLVQALWIEDVIGERP